MRALTFPSALVAVLLLPLACDENNARPSAPRETQDASATSPDASAAPAPNDPTTPDADAPTPNDGVPEAGSTAMTLTGPWQDGAAIDAKYTCNGSNVSPALAWSNAPAGTQSFAIVVRDTSLKVDENFHWVLFNIPPETTSIAEGIQKTATPSSPAGARQTKWSFGAQIGYSGPCPPSGTHTYVFSVYALNTNLDASLDAPVAAEAAIQASKLGSATLTGTYAQ